MQRENQEEQGNVLLDSHFCCLEVYWKLSARLQFNRLERMDCLDLPRIDSGTEILAKTF